MSDDDLSERQLFLIVPKRRLFVFEDVLAVRRHLLAVTQRTSRSAGSNAADDTRDEIERQTAKITLGFCEVL